MKRNRPKREYQLLDSTILVFAYSTGHSHQTESQRLIELAVGPDSHYVVAHQNLLEWYSVVTSVKRSPNPLLPEQAGEVLRRLAHSKLKIIWANEATLALFLQLSSVQPSVRGKDIYDRYLAATALSNGVTTIVTENTKDFLAVPGLSVINPFLA